ncbi:MAG TPA: hypothetical protein VJ464_08070 [Blastocatellia bacterium]|nr:hypothetical protein [Blastocatellia bacterium]
MNHQQIDQFDLIDRYLMGKLLAEESASFEAHFVDCPQCIARLQLTKTFLEDLRGVAAAQSWPIAPPPARGFRPFLQTFLRWPFALAVAGLLIAAIISAIIVVGYTRRLRNEADLARQLAAQWEGRYEGERQAAMAAESQRREEDSQQAEQRRALEARLADEAARHGQLEAEGSRTMTVGGNLIVAPLISVRGSEPAETINQVIVPRSASLFAIMLTLDGEGEYKSYRGTIVDGSGRAIWSGRLTPNRHDTLSAWFKPERFQPGNYSLTVEGVKPGGGRAVIGQYPFVLKKTS